MNVRRPVQPKSSRELGLTLLEVTLALGLMVGLTVSIFMMYRVQTRNVQVVMGDLKGHQQGAETLALISKELSNATAVTVTSTSSITYTKFHPSGPNTNHVISLGAAVASDPRYRLLLLDGQPITQERLLQNHNPLRKLFREADGTIPASPKAIDIFSPVGPLNRGQRIDIYLVIQPTADSVESYLRTSITLRNP